MKIVFIGTVEFSLKALEQLIDMSANIVGVCTQEESSFNSDFANLKPLCDKHFIPCLQTNNINSTNTLQWIQKLKPDIVFCFGWSSLIRKELLTLPPMGIVGFHPAQLPHNRGRHPIIWSLVLGLEVTSSTFFFMDEEADSGDILSQENLNIEYKDDAQSLYNKIISTALIQIKTFVPLLENKKYIRKKQDHNISNAWRKRNKIDGKIDFRMSSRAIYNLVRALTKPYIGAHIEYNKKDIKVWKVEEVPNHEKNIEPGKVITVQDHTLLIKCYDGAIKILEYDNNEKINVGDYL